MEVTYNYSFDDHPLLVKENNKSYSIDLRERLLEFSVSILKFLRRLPYRKEYDVLRRQLSKSATSIGANYEAKACIIKTEYQ
jgi:hypothetical protein